jgi:hypothetical protein
MARSAKLVGYAEIILINDCYNNVPSIKLPIGFRTPCSPPPMKYSGYQSVRGLVQLILG